MERDPRTITSARLPSVLTAETAGQRALSWPPLRDGLIDLIGRWDLLGERASDDRRRNRAGQIRSLLQELVAAVDAENEAPAAGRDWRLLRPRVDQAGQALSTMLAGVPQPGSPAGEVVIFDRSWYNRAGVERVMGFCTPEDRAVPRADAAGREDMVDSGILLLKYWLEVSPEEQTRRPESRINDPRKVWKLSDMGLRSYSRWYDYSRARDAMLAATDTSWAPWYVARTDDRKRGRLNLISHLLGQVPYKPLVQRDVTLPKRQGTAATRSRAPIAVHPHPVLSRAAPSKLRSPAAPQAPVALT